MSRLRIDVNGNLITKTFLYDRNETMFVLGKQNDICADSSFSKCVDDVISAYVNDMKDDNNKIAQTGFELFKTYGSFYSMVSCLINLGIIIGKRQERQRRKGVINENL